MTDEPNSGENPQPAKRGDAAWREERDRIDARNDAARKAGKQRRADYERVKDDARRSADAHRRAEALDKQGPKG